MATKIDLDKAYDKLEWSFIKYTLFFLSISCTYYWLDNGMHIICFSLYYLEWCTCKVEFIQSLVCFILCQFACNSAFKNPVFMWESCKDSVWKSVKEAQECEESSRVCTQ